MRQPVTTVAVRSDPSSETRVTNTNNHANRNQSQSHSTVNFVSGRLSQRTVSPLMESLSRLRSMREPTPLLSGDQREVKINDIVGNGISGILHKWVNYGKGWRPRWFVLQDGVLSYYKIHGPDKIVVSQETEKGSKVIGEESLRQIAQHRNGNLLLRRKPFGEVHLKVSSIRESKSDGKRFSIFTGTKRLHLRAETREDRVGWMEALQAVKDMLPRISISELMAITQNVISTERLKQRLLEEGVSEAAIQDSEHIMKNEFASLQDQIVLLKQKQWLLIDTLRQLGVHVINSRNRNSN